MMSKLLPQNERNSLSWVKKMVRIVRLVRFLEEVLMPWNAFDIYWPLDGCRLILTVLLKSFWFKVIWFNLIWFISIQFNSQFYFTLNANVILWWQSFTADILRKKPEIFILLFMSLFTFPCQYTIESIWYHSGILMFQFLLSDFAWLQ